MTDTAYLTIVATIITVVTTFTIDFLKWLSQRRQERSQIAATDASANSSMADATESLTSSAKTIAETMQRLLSDAAVARHEAEQGRVLAEEKIHKLEREFNEFKKFCEVEKAQHDKTVRDFKLLIEAYDQLKVKFDELEKRNAALELDNKNLRESLDALESQINGVKLL